MESIRSFITTNKNRNEVKAQEMALVMHEIVAKDIGIRGSNVFTITYSFIAAVCISEHVKLGSRYFLMYFKYFRS